MFKIMYKFEGIEEFVEATETATEASAIIQQFADRKLYHVKRCTATEAAALTAQRDAEFARLDEIVVRSENTPINSQSGPALMLERAAGRMVV